MIILGDGGYRSTGYITLTKMAHQLLTFAFHLNVLIGQQKEEVEWQPIRSFKWKAKVNSWWAILVSVI